MLSPPPAPLSPSVPHCSEECCDFHGNRTTSGGWLSLVGLVRGKFGAVLPGVLGSAWGFPGGYLKSDEVRNVKGYEESIVKLHAEGPKYAPGIS